MAAAGGESGEHPPGLEWDTAFVLFGGIVAATAIDAGLLVRYESAVHGAE
jgi:hypothetical protein